MQLDRFFLARSRNSDRRPDAEDNPARGMFPVYRRASMKGDPEDEPGIYLLYALIMFGGIIAAAVIAAGILVRASL
jgi:hypothetical protein